MPTTRQSSARKPPAPTAGQPDAIELLMRAHHEVAELFAKFEAAVNGSRRAVAERICAALELHSQIETELFYPAAGSVLGKGGARLLGEARLEHWILTTLIEEIRAATPGHALLDVRVKVLRDYVTLHVAEEENDLFPRVRMSGLDLAALGLDLVDRQADLDATARTRRRRSARI